MTMANLANTDILVTRFSKGVLVGGKLKASMQKPFKSYVGVQAITGRDREVLPEGRRQSYVVKVYSNVRFLVDDDNDAQRGDLLQIDGEMFEVFQVDRFKGLGLDHYRSLAARLNS